MVFPNMLLLRLVTTVQLVFFPSSSLVSCLLSEVLTVVFSCLVVSSLVSRMSLSSMVLPGRVLVALYRVSSVPARSGLLLLLLELLLLPPLVSAGRLLVLLRRRRPCTLCSRRPRCGAPDAPTATPGQTLSAASGWRLVTLRALPLSLLVELDVVLGSRLTCLLLLLSCSGQAGALAKWPTPSHW